MKIKLFAGIILATLLIITASACSSVPTDDTNGNLEDPKSALGLEDGTWILQSYGDSANPKTVLEGTLIFAEFDESTGQVTGNAGANSYFGSYELGDTTLTIPGPIGATEMYRMEPEGVMDQEQEYLSLLQQSETYLIIGDQLSITCDNQILNFQYTTGLKPAA